MNIFKFYKNYGVLKAKDYIQRYCLKSLSIVICISSFLIPSRVIRIKLVMKSHRLNPNKLAEKIVKKNLVYIQINACDLFDGCDSAGETIQKKRAIVLKNPLLDEMGGVKEKGVLLIKYTGTFQYYIKCVNVKDLQRYFWIVLEPSWSGYCLSEILWWSQFSRPVFVQSSEMMDYKFMADVSKKLVPLTIGSSDWVNHETFCPTEDRIRKKYDSVYVSNFSPIKRNYVFLDAIAKIKDRTYKSALICSGWGESRDLILEMIKLRGLEDRVDVYEKLSQPELNRVLNMAKVNVLLSLKEGSNRSIFEGMFSGTPAVLLKNNIGVNKSYINSRTGSLVDEKNLIPTLLWYRDNWIKFSPREWAMDHISIQCTKRKLDLAVNEKSHEYGEQYTYGTVLKVNAPEAKYFEPEDENKMIDVKDLLRIFSNTRKNRSGIESDMNHAIQCLSMKTR